MDEAFNRRDVIRTVGGAGLAAVFGVRALQFLGEDAEAATTRVSSPRKRRKVPTGSTEPSRGAMSPKVRREPPS